jgi:hypothetical protein
VRLKHEEVFTLGRGGGGKERPLERIKEYLTSPPVLWALKVSKEFKIYIAAQEHVRGAVLT